MLTRNAQIQYLVTNRSTICVLMGRVSDANIQLIRAAITLFYTRSYTAVGVQEICDVAGVKKGSFYYFFDSKQTLALAAIDYLWENYRDGFLQRIFALDTMPVIERFRQFFEQMYQREVNRPEPVKGCHFGNLATELSTQDAIIQDRLRVIFSEWTDVLETALKQGVASGELSPIRNTRELAESILALFEGAAVLGKTYNNPIYLRQMGEQAVILIQMANGQ